MKRLITLFILIAFAGLFHHCLYAQSNSSTASISDTNIVFKIKPSATDSTITATDVAHLVMYNGTIPQGKLFLFLPGTNGIPEKGPKLLFQTAIEQGYRVINLSYINQPSVARIGKGETLENDPDCTEKFRNHRTFGTPLTSFIADEPQDAIVNRFTKLLIYLTHFDQSGNWDMYLKNGAPNWEMITVAGQSQGGGMAAIIAKRHLVNSIITFSGGWDYSKRYDDKKNTIANWYFNESITPPERWFGTYHVEETTASIIDETYKAMAIPENQIYPLNRERREGKRAHGEGVRNVIYKDLWINMLGDGSFD